MSDQQTPAGWFPDPNLPGMQRWYDGTRWTEHTAPLAAAPATPLPPAAPVAAPVSPPPATPAPGASLGAGPTAALPTPIPGAPPSGTYAAAPPAPSGGASKAVIIPVIACLALVVLAVAIGAVVYLSDDGDDDERTATGGNGSSQTTDDDGGDGGDGDPPATDDGDPTTTTAPPQSADPQPAQASPYIGGNVEPSFPDGDEDVLAVIAVGAPDGDDSTIPFVVRNNTGTAMYGLGASGRATDDGALVGSGDSLTVVPAVVQPGEIAFGVVYFASAPPRSSTIEITATGEPEEDEFFRYVPLVIGETNYVPDDFADTIVGEVSTEEQAVSSPTSVLVLCVDEAGTVSHSETGYTDGSGDVAAGASATFSVSLYDDRPCDSYLIGASGFEA